MTSQVGWMQGNLDHELCDHTDDVTQRCRWAGCKAILKGIEAGSIGTGSISTLTMRENKLSKGEQAKGAALWADKGKLEI
jgi:hypothetical protein